MPVDYTLAAKRDLQKIRNDLAQARGADFANRYMQGLENRIESLSSQPKRYQVRPKLGKGRRLMPERPYHVIYQVDDQSVLIVRILHGRRKITRSSIDT